MTTLTNVIASDPVPAIAARPGTAGRLVVQSDAPSAPALHIELTRSGPWNRLFESFDAPAAGEFDRLAAWVGSIPADATITIEGCPSAAVLPVLWLKTALAPAAELSLSWPHIDDPANQQGRQEAGRLALLLADRVVCADTHSAWTRWGYDAAAVSDRGSAHHGEAFDLLAGIVDIWDADLRGAWARASHWEGAVRAAIAACAQRGHKRIAIYGAGTHTRAVGEAIMEPEIEIACIIDDDARRHGERLWGYPITGLDGAASMNIDAVILSANSIESVLYDNTEPLRQRGIDVIRLYTQG